MLLDSCLRISLDLVLIRVIVNAAEALGSRQDYCAEGIFSWTAMRLQRHWVRTEGVIGAISTLLGETLFLHVSGIQIFLAALVFLLPAVNTLFRESTLGN